jgi:hypothetical protein
MKLILTGLVFLFLCCGIEASAQQQRADTISITGKAIAASRVNNPHTPTSIPSTDIPVAKSRSSGGEIAFDNWTGFFVKLFVDGIYRGTVEPWGRARVAVADGVTPVYAITVGGTIEWSYTIDTRITGCIYIK